ncbi:hypothetical protein GJ496_003573, partial [Pomphorhynchus laevis]
VEEYFSLLNESILKYRYAIRKRPRFLFHLNEYSKQTFEWVNNLNIDGMINNAKIGWHFFSAMSVCIKTDRIIISKHNNKDRDSVLIDLISYTLGDPDSKTLIVCADKTSNDHVNNIITHNVGGILNVQTVNVRAASNCIPLNHFDVIIFYDNVNIVHQNWIIVSCGYERLRHIHMLENFEEELIRSNEKKSYCYRLAYFGQCKRTATCNHSTFNTCQTVLFPSIENHSQDTLSYQNSTLYKLAQLIQNNPHNRIISLRIRSVIDPSRFYACLLSHYSSGTIFDCTQSLMDMYYYFSTADQPEELTVADALQRPYSELFAYKDHGCVYRRVYVEMTDDDRLCVFMVDTGIHEFVLPNDRLFVLEKRFQDFPMSVVECINVGIKPADNDDYWPVLSRRAADKLLRGKVVQAEVALISTKHVWLEKVNETVNLNILRISLRGETFKCTMISDSLAIENEHHLTKLSETFGIDILNVKVSVQQHNYKISDIAIVKLTDGCIVNICSTGLDNYVYVHRNDLKKQLDTVNFEITNLAKSANSHLNISDEDLCIVKIDSTDRPVNDQYWYRAVKLEKSGCFRLIDYGNHVTHPSEIRHYNIELLRVMAMCKPIQLDLYCFSANTEDMMNKDFIYIEVENGEKRLLSIDVPTEPVDISLHLNSLWPTAELLDRFCQSDDDYIGPFKSFIRTKEALCNHNDWKLALQFWITLHPEGKLSALEFTSFCIVLSWKTDVELVKSLECLDESIDLTISHLIRSIVLEQNDQLKNFCAQTLLSIISDRDAQEMLKINGIDNRILSIFRAALSLSKSDIALCEAFLRLIPKPNKDGVRINFDSIDSLRSYLSKYPPSLEVIHLFRQCIYRFENVLADQEEYIDRVKESKPRIELLKNDTELSDIDSNSVAAATESSDSSLYDNFIENLQEVIKEAEIEYNRNGSSDEEYNLVNDVPKLCNNTENKPVKVDDNGLKPENTNDQKFPKPLILWHQNDDNIFLEIQKCGKCNVIWSEDKVNCRIVERSGDVYGFSLELFGFIKSAVIVEKEITIKLILEKKTAERWTRVQKSRKQPFFLRFDTSKLSGSESDTSEHNEDVFADNLSDNEASSVSSTGMDTLHDDQNHIFSDD